MNNHYLQPKQLNFETFPIRYIEDSGTVWWVAVDICRVLEVKDHSNALKKLDEQERMKLALRAGKTWCVNGSGLYNLIFSSDKPIAKQLYDWLESQMTPELSDSDLIPTDDSLNLECGHSPVPPQAVSAPNFSLTPIEAINLAVSKLIDLGLPREQAGLFEFEQLSICDSNNKSIWLAAKNWLESITASTERLAVPKEIGELLAVKQGLKEPISAVKINQMLEAARLQYKKSRISQKSGQQKWDWVLTDAGQQYGTYVFTVIQNSTGNRQPIKWYPIKTVEFLDNWTKNKQS